jgi:hypothetical protein
MPNTAHHSSSPGFVFLKHAHLASRAYPPPPGLASLTERPASVLSAHHRVAGAKGGYARGRGVWQDKRGLSSARKGTKQPARSATPAARSKVNNAFVRLQNHFSALAPLVQLPLWVKPIMKAEVQRMAEINDISPSAQGADLLEEMLRQKLHIQQAATLETALEKIINRAISRRDARLAHLLVRVAFASEQGRGLSSTILSRMPGMTTKLHDKILDDSAKAAKKKITHSSPQLEDIMKDLEALFAEQEEGRERER